MLASETRFEINDGAGEVMEVGGVGPALVHVHGTAAREQFPAVGAGRVDPEALAPAKPRYSGAIPVGVITQAGGP